MTAEREIRRRARPGLAGRRVRRTDRAVVGGEATLRAAIAPSTEAYGCFCRRAERSGERVSATLRAEPGSAGEPRQVLAARGITKSFPGVLALDNIDFDVRAGEVTALLGENGAGKSTLIKMMAGFYSPDRGEISVDR